MTLISQPNQHANLQEFEGSACAADPSPKIHSRELPIAAICSLKPPSFPDWSPSFHLRSLSNTMGRRWIFGVGSCFYDCLFLGVA